MTIMSLHTQQIPKLHTVTTPPLLPAAVVIAQYCSKLLGRECVRRLEGGGGERREQLPSPGDRYR